MKRIFDPVHHFIELDAGEIALLDTAPMQRLRRLRQLGLAYLAFPAAEHSRFSHALGALAAGERALATLRAHDDDGYFADSRDYEAQRRLLRASLLLHDVGHGPFSHACEAVLGRSHETRTREILETDEMRRALGRLGVDPLEVLGLVTGTAPPHLAVLQELVSGPNLDADRMDYLLRDAYFTGVVNGRYDAEQLLVSLRVYDRSGRPALGVDGRGIVALESFVLARYMMFATVYFHHTTRMFERVLQEALGELWPEPRALDPVAAFLAWDDFRVMDALREATGASGRALRSRDKRYVVAAEFNAERDLASFEASQAALEAAFPGAVWADAQEQLMHRLPLGIRPGTASVLVRTSHGLEDARHASDLIDRLSGKAFWRKLFVRRDEVPIAAARRICRDASTGARR